MVVPAPYTIAKRHRAVGLSAYSFRGAGPSRVSLCIYNKLVHYLVEDFEYKYFISNPFTGDPDFATRQPDFSTSAAHRTQEHFQPGDRVCSYDAGRRDRRHYADTVGKLGPATFSRERWRKAYQHLLHHRHRLGECVVAQAK